MDRRKVQELGKVPDPDSQLVVTGGPSPHVQSPLRERGYEGMAGVRVVVGVDNGAHCYYGKSHLFRRLPLGTYKVRA